MTDEDYGISGKHESANDLPTVKELRSSVAGLKLLGWLLWNSEIRETARGISEDIDELVSLVDDFYRLLGSRNWVFSNALDLERMRAVVSKPTAEEAERELIEYLKEKGTLHWMISRMDRFPDLRPRMSLLEKAEEDFLAGRYYSSVLVTVSVMDGFVNDAFKSEGRKGLHARTAEELHSVNCVATVWDGLPSVQKTFTRSVCARKDEPFYEVCRHGIMHGMITDYDNDVVASKAWCMLFGAGDWVDSKAKEQEKGEEEPRSLLQALKDHSEVQKHIAESNKRLEVWKEHPVELEHPVGPDEELVKSCVGFLEAWKEKNYGVLGSFFPNFTNRTPNAQAGEAREYYSPHPIEKYEIEKIDRPAAALVIARVRLFSPNESWTASIRFSRFNGADSAAEWEPGEWKVLGYGTDPFVDSEE